ncbi:MULTISPECIES: class I SAM-dependent methyltransferase [unclassified Streptomyces]|uniref:class I SAM-dependent methyltransferase n=1 Tax=unclassified Streptomyces TaxID=2593676 RepID=UPI001F0472BC|nr:MULTISPECIES: class I SAM-dependent methyltransferase [unclassified Streptomyces]MCH0565055.1 class I SAM-dependent methyltransferase [Streptomyces sp. MUM 2J]MCH0572803.1 class I SAM-dependent methyltransferase [Streptomyces sp. MUM 136J]
MPPRPIHEPRREDCPWCGAPRLRTRLRAPDLRHGRPGTFTVDECRDCAHVFQNPRLTPEGLALYREGGPGASDEGSAVRRRHHRDAARAVLRHCPEPESWLDVGTGDAAFPRAAKELFPYTSFDGTDPTPRVVRARRAERVEEAHVGRLTVPELTARLRARYDVVSVLGQLQRSPDPRAELRAALTALRPGGHLLLELPDPACSFAAVLGKWWHSHGQPHHLQLLPLANIRAELEEQGCTILTADRGSAHVPRDLARAVSLAAGRKLPRPLTRSLTATAGTADRTLSPLLRRTRFANSYRVIARKGQL